MNFETADFTFFEFHQSGTLSQISFTCSAAFLGLSKNTLASIKKSKYSSAFSLISQKFGSQKITVGIFLLKASKKVVALYVPIKSLVLPRYEFKSLNAGSKFILLLKSFHLKVCSQPRSYGESLTAKF